MAGTVWRDIRTGETVFPMGHLHPQRCCVDVKRYFCRYRNCFGFHVFTDENKTGMLMKFKEEQRFFCRERYEGSKTIVHRILQSKLHC